MVKSYFLNYLRAYSLNKSEHPHSNTRGNEEFKENLWLQKWLRVVELILFSQSWPKIFCSSTFGG